MAPFYRRELWRAMSRELGVEFWCDTTERQGIKTIDLAKESIPHKTLRNVIFKGVMIWQIGVIGSLLRNKNRITVVVVLGEAYCLSNWVVLFLCKMLRLPTCIWTHGLYGNESFWKKALRLKFYKQATHVLTYERRARKLMIGSGFSDQKISVIYNSLHYSRQLLLRSTISSDKPKHFPFFKNPSVKCLVFIGRLSSTKKLDILINVFKQLSADYNLLLIGDGPERQSLENSLAEELVNQRVYFTGGLYDECEIAPLLYNADLCVSPGNVGLTCIHALSYGTPVATHNDFSNQGPEVEAIDEGNTGFLFDAGDLHSLLEGINQWFDKPQNRQELREKCYQIIDKYYNPGYQVSVFKKVFETIT